MRVVLPDEVFRTKAGPGIVGFSKSKGYALIREGRFPTGHVLPNGRRGWFDTEIFEWMRQWREDHPAPQRVDAAA